jgi:hypothetical protein
MNDELEKIWKDAIIAQSWHYHGTVIIIIIITTITVIVCRDVDIFAARNVKVK